MRNRVDKIALSTKNSLYFVDRTCPRDSGRQCGSWCAKFQLAKGNRTGNVHLTCGETLLWTFDKKDVDKLTDEKH